MIGLPPNDTNAQVAKTLAVLHQHLGETTVAVHLFGSAVHGGLRPLSDLDLLVTVNHAPSAATRRSLLMRLLTISAPPGASTSMRALEVTVLAHSQVVPWRYPPQREMQFGEWLRDTLSAGIFEEPALDHDVAILLTQVRGHSVNLVGPEATRLFEPVPRRDLIRSLMDTVRLWQETADWTGDERNVALALARCWYTACTGEIATKSDAAAWLLDRVQGSHRMILANARAAYLGEQRDALSNYPAEFAAFVTHARQRIELRCASLTDPAR